MEILIISGIIGIPFFIVSEGFNTPLPWSVILGIKP
jgi:hypothetical protein